MHAVKFCMKLTACNVRVAVKLSTCSTLCNKSDTKRQAKIFGKLIGKRISGSKQRWFENPTSSMRETTNSPFNFSPSKNGGQSYKRRTAVLNKLFMTHITSLLATGEVSQTINGKGLQITRVKITQDFNICNVYWMGRGDETEIKLEEELQKCGGRLRHELSQLYLMGEVPRIHFVKDKASSNIAHVQTILRTCDFGKRHEESDPSYEVKQDLYQQSPTKVRHTSQSQGENEDDEDEPLPEMRHDVFGLDHRGIMLKILAKMKKSEQAWQQLNERDKSGDSPQNRNMDKDEKVKLTVLERENDGSFEKFLSQLAKSKRKRNRFFDNNDINGRREVDEYHDPLRDGDFIDEDDKK